MATIQERRTSSGERHYRALVRVKGRPSQTATFRRKTDARKWAQRVEADIRRGKFFPDRDARRRTLADLIDRYLVSIRQRLSAGDLPNRERQLRWWAKQLGDIPLADIRPRMISAARDRLARKGLSGRPISPGTQNRYLGTLSAAMSYAVRELEWLEANPVRIVRRAREPRGRVRFLDDDERDRLLAACQESRNPHLHLLTLLAISTGMRRGELLALRWRDVDLERGVAVLHHTKNGHRRAVPIVGPALDELRVLAGPKPDPAAPVFPGRKGCAQFPQSAWNKALERAGIKDFRFHDCRHTAASYLAQSGARLHEIAEILGHRTLAMVQRYAHLTDRHNHKVAQRMVEKFLS